MYAKNKDYIISTVFPIFCIWAAVFLTGMQSLRLPGLYYDAVYPDYLAAVGAFPGVDNFTQITQHTGLPLLGNFYHGTITAGVQYVVLKCFGHANLYTLRITNLFYFAVAGSLLYALCRRLCHSVAIPLAGALLCVTAPNVLAFTRTQYYIMLPGCIFFMCSLYFLVIAADKIRGGSRTVLREVILSGIFQGLAFYGYFTYLFLAPVSMILIGTLLSPPRRWLKRELAYILGILIGSTGYFIGYYDSALTNFFGHQPLTYVLLYGGILCMAAYFAVAVFCCVGEENATHRTVLKIFAWFHFAAVVAICIGIVALLPEFGDKLRAGENLLAQMGTRNKNNRLLVFWELLYALVSSRSAQDLIFKEELKGAFEIYCYAGVVMLAVTGFLIVYNNRKRKTDAPLPGYIGVGYLYLFGYYVSTFPLSNSMQPQHFVAMYFWLFMIMILEAAYAAAYLPKRAVRLIGIGAAALCMWINVVNDAAFVHMLHQTEGRGRFNTALDRFAADAYLDEDKANKIYVFPQWGLQANFIYLTENSCATVRGEDIDCGMLQEKADAGYILVIAAFDKQEIFDITEKLDVEKWQWEEELSREGDCIVNYAVSGSDAL